MSAAGCAKCGAAFGLLRWRHRCEGDCGDVFCSACLSFALVKEATAEVGSDAVSKLCRPCYLRHSSLDFDVKEEVVDPPAAAAPRGVALLLHGGAGSRKMFLRLARALAAGPTALRCVLIDLPGHGARMDEPLSIASALAVAKAAAAAHALPPPARAPIVIGGSLGGYLAMELVGAAPDAVSAAVVLMAGQTAKGNGHISREDLLELALRPGMFFQSGVEQVEVLRGTNPRAALAAFAGKPVLFVNGSLDHRDGERVWLAAAGPRAQLITYEGGDHFFSHDSRFAQRLADDVAAFCARNELLLPTGIARAVHAAALAAAAAADGDAILDLALGLLAAGAGLAPVSPAARAPWAPFSLTSPTIELSDASGARAYLRCAAREADDALDEAVDVVLLPPAPPAAPPPAALWARVRLDASRSAWDTALRVALLHPLVGGASPAPALHLLPADVFRHVLRFVASPVDALQLASSFRGAGALVRSARPAWAAWHAGWAPRLLGRDEWRDAEARARAQADSASAALAVGGEGPSAEFLLFKRTWAVAVAERRARAAEDEARRRRAQWRAAATSFSARGHAGALGAPFVDPAVLRHGLLAPPLRGPGGIGLGGFGMGREW